IVEGEEEECDTVKVKAGCGITVDKDGVSVDIDSLIGEDSGLVIVAGEEEECPTLAVDLESVAGCHIEIRDDTITVDTESLAGSGLTTEAGEESCTRLAVSPGCGLDID